MLTMASYFLAIKLASVDFPDNGGPSTHTLHGNKGCGGTKYFLGQRTNFTNDSADDILYILSIKLKQPAVITYIRQYGYAHVPVTVVYEVYNKYMLH